MDIKVNTNAGTPKVDKKKKTGASAASGAAFASLLNQASNNDEIETLSPTLGGAGVLVEEDIKNPYADIPTEPEARSAYMLDALEELEQDILTGNPTDAVMKLKRALEAQSDGYDALTSAQQEIADEIDLRASVEIAKIEAEN